MLYTVYDIICMYKYYIVLFNDDECLVYICISGYLDSEVMSILSISDKFGYTLRCCWFVPVLLLGGYTNTAIGQHSMVQLGISGLVFQLFVS